MNPFVEGPLISCKQILYGILPSKVLLYPRVTEFSHRSSYIGIFEQPKNLICKIYPLIMIVAVERRLACAESTFL